MIYVFCDVEGRVIVGNVVFVDVLFGFLNFVLDGCWEVLIGYKLFKGWFGDNELIVGMSEDDIE